jgi:hypothetical protein
MSFSSALVASKTVICDTSGLASKHNSHSKPLRPWSPCPDLRYAHTSGGGGAAHGTHGSAIARRDCWVLLPRRREGSRREPSYHGRVRSA